MNPSEQLLNDLILGTCHLCDRIRHLARSGSEDPVAIVPVREAARMVAMTVEALAASWQDGVPAALPAVPGDDALDGDWLLGADFSDSFCERGEE